MILYYSLRQEVQEQAGYILEMDNPGAISLEFFFFFKISLWLPIMIFKYKNIGKANLNVNKILMIGFTVIKQAARTS